MMKSLFPALLGIFLLTTAVQAQLPIRNFIYQNEEAITQQLNELNVVFEAIDEESWEENVSYRQLYCYASEDKLNEGDLDAIFYMRNDSCYQMTYYFGDDEYVLDNLRDVIDRREDFSPCFDLLDCWTQDLPQCDSTYYWNLFSEYEGTKDNRVLIIESNMNYELNSWYYEYSEGKY